MIKRETNVANETRNQVSTHQQQAQVAAAAPPQQQQQKQQQSRTQQHTSSIELDDVELSNDANQPAKFFWTVIDNQKFPGLSIPYLEKKNGAKYLSVRIIERAVLSKYENNYSDEVKKYGSLISELCTATDVTLLNEINDDHVSKAYGEEPFTLQDTLVQLDDFLKFYEILSRTCRTKEEIARQQSLRFNNSSTNNNHLAEQRRIQQKQQQQHQQQQIPLVSRQQLPPNITNVQHHQQQPRPQQLNVPDFVFNSNTQSTSNTSLIRPNLASNNISNSSLNVQPATNSINNFNNRSNPYLNSQLNAKIAPAYRQQLNNNLVNNNSNNNIVSTRQMSPSFQANANINTNSVIINSLQQKQPIMPQQQQHNHHQPYIINQSATDMRDSHSSSNSSFLINSQPVISRLLHQNSQQAAPAPSNNSAEYSISPRMSDNASHSINNTRSGLEQYHQNSNLANKQQINPQLYSKSPIPNVVHSPTPIWPNQQHQYQHQHQYHPPPPPPPASSTNDGMFFNNNSLDHLKAINKNLNPMHAQIVTTSAPTGGFSPYGQSHNGQNYQQKSFHHQSPQTQMIMPPNLHAKPQLVQPKPISSPLPPPPPPLHSPSQIPSQFLTNNSLEQTLLPPSLTANTPTLAAQLNRPSLNNNITIYNNHSPIFLNQNNQRIYLNNNNNPNNQTVYSSTNSIHANTNHSILNSPTPPLTPTPNLYATTASSSSRLNQQQQQQQQQQHQKQQQIHSDVMLNMNNISQINNNISQHSPNKKQNSPSQLIISNPTLNGNTASSKSNNNANCSNSNNVDDNDDIIILDEPIEPSVKPAQARRTSSSQMSTRSSGDTSTNLYNNVENHTSGFIQLNDLVVPYVRLMFRTYRCCSQYQPSNIFIPWHLLATTGLICKDVEHSLIVQFETIFTLERKQHPNEFNRLQELIEYANLQEAFNDANDKIIVVNLLDFFSHCSEALFLKQHKLGKQLVLNYKDILKMSGGIILLDIPDGPRDLLIFPFVNYANLVLAPYNTFSNYIRHFESSKVDNTPELLEKEIYQGTTQDTLLIRNFLNLLLFYLTDNERRCKLPPSIRLINVKPWLVKHPNEFKILCEYTRKFPLDWIASIDKVLIEFKLLTKTLSNMNNNSCSSTSSNESSTDSTTTTKKEEPDLVENEKEENEQEVAKQTISSSSSELEVEQQQKQQLESVSLSPSSMDSVTPSESPFTNQNKEDATLSKPKESASESEATKPIEPEREKPTEIEPLVQQDNEMEASNLNDKTNQEALKDTQRRLSFDFDEVEVDATSGYEIFKRKRRLSDSVLQYNVHADYYKQYLDDETSLNKTTHYDRMLSKKLDELNKKIDEQVEQDEKKKDEEITNEKNSLNEETVLTERDMQKIEKETREDNEEIFELNEKEDNSEETMNKNKRNASLTPISSVLSAKRIKYSAETKLHGDGIEDVSDSDESLFHTNQDEEKEACVKFTDWRSNDLFTSEEDFDENYYLRKFNIQECCVLLRDVGSDATPPNMPKQKHTHSHSVDSTASGSDHSKSAKQSTPSHQQLVKEEASLVTRRDSKASSISSTSTLNDSTLLQPLNFNINKSSLASTSNTGSVSSIKHKENKIGSK